MYGISALYLFAFHLNVVYISVFCVSMVTFINLVSCSLCVFTSKYVKFDIKH